MYQGKITIQSNVEEQALIENLLNMKHSGYNDNQLTFILSFHAMANKWKFDKVTYYLKVLEIEQ